MEKAFVKLPRDEQIRAEKGGADGDNNPAVRLDVMFVSVSLYFSVLFPWPHDPSSSNFNFLEFLYYVYIVVGILVVVICPLEKVPSVYLRLLLCGIAVLVMVKIGLL